MDRPATRLAHKPHRPAQPNIRETMQEAEINQQLCIMDKFKALLWQRIMEQAAPGLLPLLQAYTDLESAALLFPRFARNKLSLKGRLDYLTLANVEAEKWIR